METFKDFAAMIRRDAFTLARWACDNWVSKYHLYLYIHIQEDVDDQTCWEWDFSVKYENIREYKPYLTLQREEIERLKVEMNRDKQLNDILSHDSLEDK